MKKLLFFPLFLILSYSTFGQFDPKEIAGAYQYCPFHCITIKLNENFTFEYLLDGDLFNNQRTKGTWKFIREDKIHLKSSEKKLSYQVIEKQNSNNDKILIQAVDEHGAIIPGVDVKTKYLGKERHYKTIEEGTIEIPKTNKIEVSWLKSSRIYEIKNSQTNYLLLMIELDSEPTVDETFLSKNEKLYTIFDDDTVSTDWLDKEITKKLFPKK